MNIKHRTSNIECWMGKGGQLWTPGPNLASLSHCVETPGAAFSAIVPGMRIKSRQDRLEPDNLSSYDMFW